MGATDDNTVFEPARIYTAAEVAGKLRLSRSSVLQRARKGDLPCFKLGQHATQRASVRFLGEDMNAWLEATRSTGRTQVRHPAAVGIRQEDRLRDFARWREERRQASGAKCEAHQGASGGAVRPIRNSARSHSLP